MGISHFGFGRVLSRYGYGRNRALAQYEIRCLRTRNLISMKTPKENTKKPNNIIVTHKIRALKIKGSILSGIMPTVSRRLKKRCLVMVAFRWCDMKDMKVPFDSLWIFNGLSAVLSSYIMWSARTTHGRLAAPSTNMRSRGCCLSFGRSVVFHPLILLL